MAKIRIIRILEYIGEESSVWDHLKKCGVPPNGEKDFTYRDKGVLIKSGLVGYPDLVLENEEDPNE